MWPLSSNTFVPDKHIPDLSGQVILVTGGNAGLGKESVLRLAKHNPRKIYLGCRTESKAQDAIADIRSQLGKDSDHAGSANVDIEYLPLDLAALPSVKAAAEHVIHTTDRLDVLLLNAGIMAVPPSKTPDGFEVQLGTNHVGHFLLTKLLTPLLQTTATEHKGDIRVVSISSSGFAFAPSIDIILDTDELYKQGPWARYGASKAANIMFAAELSRRYPGFMSVSLHPGVSNTGLFANTKEAWWMRTLMAVFGPLVFSDVEQTSLNQLYLSRGMSREQLVNGGFYVPVGKIGEAKWQSDVSYGKRLWEWTEVELAKRGYN